MGRQDDSLNPDRLGVVFRPDVDVPAFGVMQLKSFAVSDGTPVVTTEQCDKDGGEGTIYINGKGIIAADNPGGCTLAHTPVKVLYDTADGTPAAGETWGPKKDTWKLGKDIDGFTVQGEVNSVQGTMYVVANGMAGKYDRCTATLADDLETTDSYINVDNVKPIRGANPTTGTSETLQVYNPRDFDSDDDAGTCIRWNVTESRWEFEDPDCKA